MSLFLLNRNKSQSSIHGVSQPNLQDQLNFILEEKDSIQQSLDKQISHNNQVQKILQHERASTKQAESYTEKQQQRLKYLQHKEAKILKQIRDLSYKLTQEKALENIRNQALKEKSKLTKSNSVKHYRLRNNIVKQNLDSIFKKQIQTNITQSEKEQKFWMRKQEHSTNLKIKEQTVVSHVQDNKYKAMNIKMGQSIADLKKQQITKNKLAGVKDRLNQSLSQYQIQQQSKKKELYIKFSKQEKKQGNIKEKEEIRDMLASQTKFGYLTPMNYGQQSQSSQFGSNNKRKSQFNSTSRSQLSKSLHVKKGQQNQFIQSQEPTSEVHEVYQDKQRVQEKQVDYAGKPSKRNDDDQIQKETIENTDNVQKAEKKVEEKLEDEKVKVKKGEEQSKTAEIKKEEKNKVKKEDDEISQGSMKSEDMQKLAGNPIIKSN